MSSFENTRKSGGTFPICKECGNAVPGKKWNELRKGELFGFAFLQVKFALKFM